MPKGGYRKPGNPAPVSGPGALSRRTDGGPTQGAKPIPANGQYGERKALQQMQSAAPMQGNPVPPVPSPKPSTPPPGTAGANPLLTNLFAPTQRPDEPITAGAPVGPGRTPTVEYNGKYRMVSKYMPMLDQMANDPDAPASFRNFLRYVKAANELGDNLP